MLITNKNRTENWQLPYRLVINGKIIWDNVEFESILLDGLRNDPKNYLPPKAINGDVSTYVSIGVKTNIPRLVGT